MARSLLELGSVELLELGAFQPKSWAPAARWNRVAPAYGRHNVRNVPGVTVNTPVPHATVTAPAYGALYRAERSYWRALFTLARSRAQQLRFNTTWRPRSEQAIDKIAALVAQDQRLLGPLVAAARAVAILAQHGVVDPQTFGVREVVAKAMASLPAADQAALMAAADAEIKKLAAAHNQAAAAESDLAATKLAAVAVAVFNPHDMTPWERLRLQGVVGGDVDAWADYVDLSADLFVGDALGATLGMNFFKKVGQFVKKAAKKIIPAVATVAGAYTGNQMLISYGVQGLFSSQIKSAQKKEQAAADAAFQQQLQQQAILQQAAVTTAVGAETLQNMGVQLPEGVQGIVQGVNASVPAGDPMRQKAAADIQATAPGNSSLALALAATGPGGIPLWGYLAGGGALLAVGGILIVALSGDGKGRKGK